jgi:CDP-diglyceride synthetase
MILWKRAALLGFLSWMIPFAISFLLFPLKKPNAPLFGTLMGLVALLTAAALLVGAPWFAIGYYSEIGLAYLAIPLFAFGAARLARS